MLSAFASDSTIRNTVALIIAPIEMDSGWADIDKCYVGGTLSVDRAEDRRNRGIESDQVRGLNGCGVL